MKKKLVKIDKWKPTAAAKKMYPGPLCYMVCRNWIKSNEDYQRVVSVRKTLKSAKESCNIDIANYTDDTIVKWQLNWVILQQPISIIENDELERTFNYRKLDIENYKNPCPPKISLEQYPVFDI